MSSHKNIDRATSDQAQNILQRYELLSNATAEGIWDYNMETGETYYNETICRMFYFTSDEMKNNKDWWEANLHPEDKSRVITAVNGTIDNSSDTWWGKYMFRCKDGTYKPVLERLYIVRDENGKAKRILGTMQDLSKVENVDDEMKQHRKIHHQQMAKKIITAEEVERKKMGFELNENINQVLATINFYLSQAKDELKENTSSWLEKAQELIAISIDEVRQISIQLSPHTLDMLGLKEALLSHLEEMEKEMEIKNRLICDKDLDSFLGTEKRIALYRIAFFQFNNIHQHSKAKFVLLRIEKIKDKIRMVISDDGVGFEPVDLKYGFGFSKIQSIVEAYNGEFSVMAQPGSGCSIEVLL